MRIPAFERYLSEKHAIAAERDLAVKDRDACRALLEAERAILADRDAQLLRATALLRLRATITGKVAIKTEPASASGKRQFDGSAPAEAAAGNPCF